MEKETQKRNKALQKEWKAVCAHEKRMGAAARKAHPAGWKTLVAEKIPHKVYTGLESAFCKGFALVFDRGSTLIEKTFDREKRKTNYAVRDYAVQITGTRKAFRQRNVQSKRSNLLNVSLTTVEGIGLGALGVGIPDVVLFLTVLLRGIYETAMDYGFSYASRAEQLWILKMMTAAVCTGEDWGYWDAQVNTSVPAEETVITEEEFESQLQTTAGVYAMDMLVLKFIQGMPVVGMLGGAANPFYYNRILKYVRLKYRKRYLMKWVSQE